MPVSGEDVGAPEQDLAVVSDPGCDAGHGLADGADLVVARPVHGGTARGFGQPVALENREAAAAEEVAEPLPERRTAGDRVLHAAAGRRSEFAVDEVAEQGVPQP